MELPVIVKKGFIGSVHASLPLTNLKGKSAQISISDIFILSGPNPSKVKSSPKETEETLYLTKMRQLQMASLMGSDMPDVTKDEKETGYLEGLAMTVIDNLQVFIDNLHFRYEDDMSNPDAPFAFGFTLQNISVQPTDSKWDPTFATDRDTMYKVLDLRNLSFYFDTSPTFYVYDDDREFCTLMKEGVTQALSEDSICGTIKATLTKNKSDTSRPQAILEFFIDTVKGGLNRQQYNRLSDWFKFISHINACLDPRPEFPQEPLERWEYTIRLVTSKLREKNETWRWMYMKKKAQDRQTYLALYKKKVLPNEEGLLVALSQEEMDEINHIEKKRSYDDLLLWRKLANTAAHLELKKKKKKKKKSTLR
eukprot:TRINITY_DN6380_c0_g1_i4.p1 TRINITY_DN6380_c0_g1~~TRINITY_DN6380_c0_g1_i4.p1  ORF type:complete len:428 (-),score=96.00 TRINITY_DN6380_c0_g1_i4:12-1109(-)